MTELYKAHQRPEATKAVIEGQVDFVWRCRSLHESPLAHAKEDFLFAGQARRGLGVAHDEQAVEVGSQRGGEAAGAHGAAVRKHRVETLGISRNGIGEELSLAHT